VLQAFMLGGDRGRLLEAARKETSPELRREAIQQLGVSGGREELWQLYQQEKDVRVRKAIINSLFICGGADRLGELATKETDPELRRDAIEKLGLTGKETLGEEVAVWRRQDLEVDASPSSLWIDVTLASPGEGERVECRVGAAPASKAFVELLKSRPMEQAA